MKLPSFFPFPHRAQAPTLLEQITCPDHDAYGVLTEYGGGTVGHCPHPGCLRVLLNTGKPLHGLDLLPHTLRNLQTPAR